MGSSSLALNNCRHGSEPQD